ncbi:HNH endonuclease, partial [Vibrio parahaemolyticus]
DRCQGDHIIPYTQGGITSQENGRLACGYHNRRNYTTQRSPSSGDDDPDHW